MRFLTRADDPPPVRLRRRRQIQRRALYGASAVLVLAASAASTSYLERDGRIAAIIAESRARLAAAGAALGLSVQSVEVVGRERTARQAILDALEVRRGTPIFSVDLDTAKARLETLPWVRVASVERLLPGTLFVRLDERRPLAVWQHDGKFDVIDQDGKIIAGADAAAFPSLLQVVGDGAPEATADLFRLLAGEPALQRHVKAAVRVGERRWNIDLDNGIQVALPEDGAAEAWHRLAALDRSDRLLERDVQVVDMRLPDRLVLRLPHDVAKSLIKKNRTAQTSPNT